REPFQRSLGQEHHTASSALDGYTGSITRDLLEPPGREVRRFTAKHAAIRLRLCQVPNATGQFCSSAWGVYRMGHLSGTDFAGCRAFQQASCRPTALE